MFRKIGLIVGCLACGMILLSACSSNALSEAKQIVAQADSVWAEGDMYSDSLSLAQAYETLSSFNDPLLSTLNSQLSTDFVHACYHYGKLLRAKDDPVAAMQVFINATHAGSDDKQILGRIYSNMGSICHLASEFPLSYEMYERSSDIFLRNGDTTAYYYALNDMAFELAEQGETGETLRLLEEIESQCTNHEVLIKIYETKAVLYRTIGQNDSAIYYVNRMQYLGLTCPAGIIIKAQAYDNLGRKDSALTLANIVMKDSRASYQNQFNALYIIQHCDSSLCAESISELASRREDIRYYEYEPEKEKNSTAVALLENDLSWTPDYRWIYAVAATIIIIGLMLGLYVQLKRHQHKLLSQRVDSLTQMNEAAEKQHAQIIQKQARHRETMVSHLEKNCNMFVNADDFPNNINWKSYEEMCKMINDNFGMLVLKLQSAFHLSEREIRLCILVLMKISGSKELASLLFYSESGIRNFKNRVAKKLGTNSTELRNTLINIAIND